MTAINNVVRLARAGTVIAWSGARVFPDDVALPPPLQLFGRMTARLRNGHDTDGGNDARLSTALTSLGPSYVKLGQFLEALYKKLGKLSLHEFAIGGPSFEDRKSVV